MNITDLLCDIHNFLYNMNLLYTVFPLIIATFCIFAKKPVWIDLHSLAFPSYKH